MSLAVVNFYNYDTIKNIVNLTTLKNATILWFILNVKILRFYRTSEAIGNREKVSKLDKSSLKPSLCKKAIDNVIEYTSTSSTMSDTKSDDLDLGLKSKSEISSNKHNSANDSCVDSSTSCSTDDDCKSVNDSNTLKSTKTLFYKINIKNDLERYCLK